MESGPVRIGPIFAISNPLCIPIMALFLMKPWVFHKSNGGEAVHVHILPSCAYLATCMGIMNKIIIRWVEMRMRLTKVTTLIGYWS